MRAWFGLFVLAALVAPVPGGAAGGDLCLVPYPKQVRLSGATLSLGRAVRLRATAGAASGQAAADVQEELARVLGARATIGTAPLEADGLRSLCAAPIRPGRRPAWPAALAPPEQPEGYALQVTPLGIRIDARTDAGLLRGAATLCQLLRANLRAGRLPCATIVDYPSMRYRGFLDDITRGPSPTLATLQREARMTAYLRMNFLTYYMEQQYAFARHPDIGPVGGSLLPRELSTLVDDAGRRDVEIIGCQQSFGHFGNILRLPAYADLRETGDVLNPTTEATYRLLDDLYSEEAPLTRSPFFLVCCDETYGLGTGPSKPLADRIGVGGVYAQHLRRLHDLLRDRYRKRMMMWGDIILQHPDHLSEIPRDTVMLSWGYDARASFDDAIVPFTKAGYDFFVCPGTSNWSRILPDFGTAAANIRNYVRDGARHDAMGVLTTTWNDDGETLFAPNWYSLAWSAECAWNGAATRQEDFDRRVGSVLFGDRTDHFGRAVGMLARTHRLPGFEGMMDARFWQAEAQGPIVSREALARQARELLALVDPAIRELQAARGAAVVNGDLIDHYLFGARRMRFIATRSLAAVRAAELYRQAADPTLAAGTRRGALAAALREAGAMHTQWSALKAEHARLWLQEKRPYALDRVLARYDAALARWQRIAAGLHAGQRALAQGKPMPKPSDLGLALTEVGVRRTAPTQSLAAPLVPDAPWAAPRLPRRLALRVSAAGRARTDLPVEVDLPAAVPATGDLLLFEQRGDGPPEPLPCQAVSSEGRPRLAFLAPGPTPAGSIRTFWLYFGDPSPRSVRRRAAERVAAAGRRHARHAISERGQPLVDTGAPISESRRLPVRTDRPILESRRLLVETDQPILRSRWLPVEARRSILQTKCFPVRTEVPVLETRSFPVRAPARWHARPAGTQIAVMVPLGGATGRGGNDQGRAGAVASAPPAAVSVAKGPRGMWWVANGPLRLLIGSEGAHIYRWEVEALGGRDLTEPGDTDWQGFADINGANRRLPNRIEVLAAGPVLARLRCTDATGLQKTFDVWAGMPWVDVRLNAASTWLACYDDNAVMGAGTRTPGRYLFENGDTGPLRPLTGSLDCQDRRAGQHWCAKYVEGGPLLGIVTPEATPVHMVGPGGGMGGVVVDAGPATAHFVIYGGACPPSPALTLNDLRATLDYAHPPDVTVYGVQKRP